MFTRCHFQNVLATVPCSKSTVFEIYQQILCRLRVNRRLFPKICHSFHVVAVSYECGFTCSKSVLQSLPDRSLFYIPLHFLACVLLYRLTVTESAFPGSAVPTVNKTEKKSGMVELQTGDSWNAIQLKAIFLSLNELKMCPL